MPLRPLLLLLLVSAVSASANATSFEAGVGCNGPFHSNPGPGPVSDSCNPPDGVAPRIGPAGTGEFTSIANSGVGPGGFSLNTVTTLDTHGATSGVETISSQAFGEWRFDDFVVTGTGSQSTPVLAAMNLWISGSLGGTESSDNEGPLTGLSSGGGGFHFDIWLNGAHAGGGNWTWNLSNGTVAENIEGMLIGHYGGSGSLADTVTSNQLMLPVGQVFDVRVLVNASSRAQVFIGGTPEDEFDTVHASAGGYSSFGSTVRFPFDRPVFDLPPGYTVNSVSAGVIDNQVVPEPGTGALFALGILGFALRRR